MSADAGGGGVKKISETKGRENEKKKENKIKNKPPWVPHGEVL